MATGKPVRRRCYMGKSGYKLTRGICLCNFSSGCATERRMLVETSRRFRRSRRGLLISRSHIVSTFVLGTEVGRVWAFDVKNQLGICYGITEGKKRGCLTNWPRSHTVSARFHVWRVEVSDAQFMWLYRQRHEIREGS
jgi:hypothetical protein